MRLLTREDVIVETFCEEEHIPIVGNAIDSGDKTFDNKVCLDILRDRHSGNSWAWCIGCVTVSFHCFKHTEYLGACSYDNSQDFKDCLYHYEMVMTGLEEINIQIQTAAKIITELGD